MEAGFRLKSPCIPPDNGVQHSGGQIEDLWERRGWKLLARNPLFLSFAVYGCETWTLLADSEKKKKKKGSRLSKPSAWRNFSVYPIWTTRPTSGWRSASGSTSLWVHRNLFWQLSRDGNWYGLGFHTPRQPLQNDPPGHLEVWATLWWAEEMLDGQHQRVDISAPCQNCSQGPPAEKIGRGSLLNHPPPPPDDRYQGTELNWADLLMAVPWRFTQRSSSMFRSSLVDYHIVGSDLTWVIVDVAVPLLPGWLSCRWFRSSIGDYDLVVPF